MTELLKRTHVYVQHPRVYEISGCPESPDHAVTWSEYEQRLWCFVCCVDFVPEFWGIFDGPIPLGAATLLGLSFDRLSIETGEVVEFTPAKKLDRNKNPDFQDFDRERYNATWNRGEK